jgi:hypothetical protein
MWSCAEGTGRTIVAVTKNSGRSHDHGKRARERMPDAPHSVEALLGMGVYS